MRLHQLTITLLASLLCTYIAAQPPSQQSLQTFFDGWSKQELLKHASIGFYAIDENSGNVVASSEIQQSLVPASTQKIITTAAALELLGPDYRFKTELCYLGEIKNDTLWGDVIVLAGGDPALGSKYFDRHEPYKNFIAKWAEALRNQNITYISGDIFIDVSVYDDEMIPDTWIWEDLGNYYGAGVFALSAYDNTFKIHLSSPVEADLPTAIRYTTPAVQGLNFNNQVKSSDSNRDNAYIFGSPLDSNRIIRGSIPKNRPDFAIKASIPNPPKFIGEQLRDALISENINTKGIVKCGSYPRKTMLNKIMTIESPSLAAIVNITNHESVNLFAEHLLKQVAYETNGLGSTKSGVQIISDFWKGQGLNTDGLFMEDGSGLSRFNGLTAKFLVDVLRYMSKKSIHADTFFKSLPQPPNGTLWYLNEKSFPTGTLSIKSGSMTRVRSFAGELKTDRQHKIHFAIVLNNFACSQMEAIKAIEQLLLEMRKH